ncbi:hypothetical protein F6453_1069 [Marinobacter nauticus]|uniref:Uncharacterized protein n=1 Tax=Marinobacter nauticus TaxID=2743 RepID=A0A833JQS8_MARNT|nr:hypothetical protein F6453_1069 [Marinobacter nauticus]
MFAIVLGLLRLQPVTTGIFSVIPLSADNKLSILYRKAP